MYMSIAGAILTVVLFTIILAQVSSGYLVDPISLAMAAAGFSSAGYVATFLLSASLFHFDHNVRNPRLPLTTGGEGCLLYTSPSPRD